MEPDFFRIPPADNLAAKSIEAIIGLIRNGKLQRGERLPAQDELARRLGVSRTSLREALKELSYRGLIVSRHGLGTFVADSPISERETLDARLLLEPGIARRAAENAQKADFAQLDGLVERMEPYVRDNAVDEFSELDLEFHTRLAQICGNAALLRLWLSLSDMTLHQQRIAQQIPGIMKKSHYYHQKIVEAVEKRDESGAEAVMRLHLMHVRKALGTGKRRGRAG